MADVTDRITVLYGGCQRIDHETHSVMLDVSLRNNSKTPIHGPLFLKVENATSDFGRIVLVNPSPTASLDAAYLDLSSSLHGGSLAPDQTASVPMTFHFYSEHFALPSRYFVLRLKLRFFSYPAVVPDRIGSLHAITLPQP